MRDQLTQKYIVPFIVIATGSDASIVWLRGSKMYRPGTFQARPNLSPERGSGAVSRYSTLTSNCSCQFPQELLTKFAEGLLSERGMLFGGNQAFPGT